MSETRSRVFLWPCFSHLRLTVLGLSWHLGEGGQTAHPRDGGPLEQG